MSKIFLCESVPPARYYAKIENVFVMYILSGLIFMEEDMHFFLAQIEE